MKSKLCPRRQICHGVGTCEDCDFGKALQNLANKNKRLKSKNELLQAENQELKDRLDILTNPNF